MAVSAVSTERESLSMELNTPWTLYAHMPHDTDWSIDSYKPIHSTEDVPNVVKLINYIPDNVVSNCMLFFMRKHVKPVWEDPSNRNGGCFSFKIKSVNASTIWKEVCYALAGETLSKEREDSPRVMGATISPKKSFCILKLWVGDCKTRKAEELFNDTKTLRISDYVFKQHKPEF